MRLGLQLLVLFVGVTVAGAAVAGPTERACLGSDRSPGPAVCACTQAVANLIREAKIHQIPSIIQTARKDGMQLMDQHILEYLMAGTIDAGEAYSRASNKATFAPYLEARPKTPAVA